MSKNFISPKLIPNIKKERKMERRSGWRPLRQLLMRAWDGGRGKCEVERGETGFNKGDVLENQWLIQSDWWFKGGRFIYKQFLTMKTQIIVVLLISVALAGNLSVDSPTQVDTNVQVQSFPKFDPNQLTASTGNNQALDQRQFNIISNAKSSLTIPVRSFDSIFSRLPSSQEMDEVVASADAVAILKAVQNIVTNDAIPCPQAFAYALELLGRIRTAIVKKEFGVIQLQVIIDGARAEIARLQAEIDALENSKKNLWLEELREKLDKLVADLDPIYKQFNQVENQIAPNEARVAGFKQEVENLRNSNNEERNKISNNRLELSQTESKIRDLKNQLQAAEQRKAYLEASIEASIALIAENDKNAEASQAKIRELEAIIRKLRDQADALDAKAKSLEIQVERVRTELSVAEVKGDKIENQIANLRDRITEQKKYVVTEDLAALERQIDTLRKVLPSVEEEVNRQYFYCYGDGAVTIENTGSTVVYIIRGESFQALLQNTYGISFSDLQCCDEKAESANIKSVLPTEIKMTAVDIFAPEYKEEYGEPFDEVIDSNGSNKELVDFNGDFSCLAEPGVSGRGVIVGCDGNRYTVRRYANAGPPMDEFVEVASCTIIMSTVKVPRTGMSMAFTGSQGAGGVYKASMATVW